MKSNKEKIYDFIQMHDTAEKEGGVSTTYIAQALSLQQNQCQQSFECSRGRGKDT